MTDYIAAAIDRPKGSTPFFLHARMQSPHCAPRVYTRCCKYIEKELDPMKKGTCIDPVCRHVRGSVRGLRPAERRQQ